MRFEENVNLAKYTTLRIGGPARYWVAVESIDDLSRALEFAQSKNLKLFILGGGSNILVSDQGFDGLVVQIQIKNFSFQNEADRIIVKAGAGNDWDELVRHCVDKNWWGIENLSGIPGTVGAAPVQNIGAYGQELSEVLTEVEAYDRKKQGVVKLDNNDCEFAYRKSIFNSTAKGRFVVLSVSLSLSKTNKPQLGYSSLSAYFEDSQLEPGLIDIRRAVLEIRKRRGMLLGDYRSAGSFFKAAAGVHQRQFADIQATIQAGREKRLQNCCQDPWFWRQASGEVKISSACLVHFCGFYPGYRQGQVGTSPLQAVAIVNYGEATAREALDLAEEIQRKVFAELGLKLVIEPELVGFDHRC